MNQEVLNEFIEQINFEISSAYLYLGMSIQMHEMNFKGYANWLRKQYYEELEHADEFIEFIQKRDAFPQLKAIEAPVVTAKDPLDVAKGVLEHEKKVTDSIYKIHDIAKKNGDYASEIFLHSFISEQIQEEDCALDIIDKFTFAGDSKAAQYAVDKELGCRE